MPRSAMAVRVSAFMKAPPPVAKHLRAGAQQPSQHLALAFAEIGLPVLGEDILNALAGRLLDLLVGVDEGQAQARGKAAPDSRFAAAHQADHDDRFVAQSRFDRFKRLSIAHLVLLLRSSPNSS